MKGFCRGVGLLGLVLALTAPSAYAGPSFMPNGKAFGFNADLYPTDIPAGDPRTLDAAQSAGAEYIRMGINWRLYERETTNAKPVSPSFSKPLGSSTGSAETDRVDKLYLELKARGIKPVMMIHNAPDWASTFHTCLENPVVALDPNKCPKDWRTKAVVLYTATDRQEALWYFVQAVVRRYPDAIIEGTNEPDFAKVFQPQYHPPVWMIGSAQCALMGAVKNADSSRRVLSPGFYHLKYLREFYDAIGKNPNCWDDLSLHIFGITEVRTGFASGIEAQLAELRGILGPGRRIFITETGVSDTAQYNDEQFNEDARAVGEPLAARAFPRWIKYFADQPDIDGVLIHTLRQELPGLSGDLSGLGLLNKDFSIKNPGPGAIPRFCYLALSSARTYPGCGSYSLPVPPAPALPSFYKEPVLLSSKNPQVGDTPRVMFYEEGDPAPNVRIDWFRCNAVGTGCTVVAQNKSVYQIQASDRLQRLKVSVSIWNSNGSRGAQTVLGPVIGN